MSQTYILLNTTVLGTTTFPAGSSVDGNSDPIDRLREAGAVLISPASAPAPLIAAAGRALQARSKGATYQTLDQIMSSGLGARTSQLGGGSVFIYREGEPSPGGNVFGSFAEALEAARQGVPSVIRFDDSLGSLVIPGEVFNVEGTSFVGAGAVPNVLIEDGAQLQGLGYVDNLGLISVSSTPVVEMMNFQAITLNNGASLSTAAPASAPFLHVAGTISFCSVSLRYFGSIFGIGAAAPVITAELGASVGIFTDIATAMFDDVLAGAGAFVVDDLTGIAVLNRNPGISHVQLAGDITYVFG